MTPAILQCALLAGIALAAEVPAAPATGLSPAVIEQLQSGPLRGVVEIYVEEVRCVTTVRDGQARRHCTVTRRVRVPPPSAGPGGRPSPPAVVAPPAAPPAAPEDGDDEDGDADIPQGDAPPSAPPAPPTQPPALRSPAPPPAPAREPLGAGIAAREAAVLALLNRERVRQGLAAFGVDPLAVKAARAHSRDMCLRRYFGHVSPEGRQPWDRLRAAGARFSAAAENIAAGYRTAASVHAGWMQSPGHRANRMSRRYARAGVGVHDCGGTLYYTELFVK